MSVKVPLFKGDLGGSPGLKTRPRHPRHSLLVQLCCSLREQSPNIPTLLGCSRVIPNPGFIPPFSATRITREETFRRFALAQLGVSLAWCAAANVSTTRYNKKGKGVYKSGFSMIRLRLRTAASGVYLRLRSVRVEVIKVPFPDRKPL